MSSRSRSKITAKGYGCNIRKTRRDFKYRPVAKRRNRKKSSFRSASFQSTNSKPRNRTPIKSIAAKRNDPHYQNHMRSIRHTAYQPSHSPSIPILEQPKPFHQSKSANYLSGIGELLVIEEDAGDYHMNEFKDND